MPLFVLSPGIEKLQPVSISSHGLNDCAPISGVQRYRTQSGPAPASMRPFGSGSSDEDPYSVAGSGSSGSSGANMIHHATGRAQIPPPGKSAQVSSLAFSTNFLSTFH
jgi:hypothetical protein